jgi:hypothetical protein
MKSNYSFYHLSHQERQLPAGWPVAGVLTAGVLTAGAAELHLF